MQPGHFFHDRRTDTISFRGMGLIRLIKFTEDLIDLLPRNVPAVIGTLHHSRSAVLKDPRAENNAQHRHGPVRFLPAETGEPVKGTALPADTVPGLICPGHSLPVPGGQIKIFSTFL